MIENLDLGWMTQTSESKPQQITQTQDSKPTLAKKSQTLDIKLKHRIEYLDLQQKLQTQDRRFRQRIENKNLDLGQKTQILNIENLDFRIRIENREKKCYNSRFVQFIKRKPEKGLNVTLNKFNFLLEKYRVTFIFIIHIQKLYFRISSSFIGLYTGVRQKYFFNFEENYWKFNI